MESCILFKTIASDYIIISLDHNNVYLKYLKFD